MSIHADTLSEIADVQRRDRLYFVGSGVGRLRRHGSPRTRMNADASAGMDGQAEAADVNDILFDLTRQETRAYGHVFARTGLVNYWRDARRLNKNPQRAAGFVVLKAPDVPSVLSRTRLPVQPARLRSP